jgi:hypothetical protein
MAAYDGYCRAKSVTMRPLTRGTSGEVNRLIDGFGGERLAAIDFADVGQSHGSMSAFGTKQT